MKTKNDLIAFVYISETIKYWFAIALVTLILNIDSIYAQSNDTIWVPTGTAAFLDGIISGGEWNDALVISTNDGDIIYKKTTAHLYIAFTNSPYYHSTGIYFDINHDGGTSPQTDDIWLHGSAGQYEFIGTGTSWQIASPLDWAFSINTSSEYMIPLSKLGISPPNTNILGILFCFNDWSINHTDEITWPSGGYPNCSNPNTWANAIFSFASSIEEASELTSLIKVFPNPVITSLNIYFPNQTTETHTLIVYNSFGQTIRKIEHITSDHVKIDCSNWQCGLYFFELKNKNSKTGRGKFIIKSRV
ncbi:T9SS type A sorting domain-containing protein [Bacteroidota bacterium]